MDRLLRLDCSHALAFEWLAHLVACNVCRRRLARHCPEESRRILDRFLLLSDARQTTVRVHPSAYDRVFERIRVRDLTRKPIGGGESGRDRDTGSDTGRDTSVRIS